MDRRLLSSIVVAALLGCGETPLRPTVELQSSPSPTVASDPTAAGDSDVAAALRRAENEQKPLLICFTAEWCSFSRQMRDEVFRRPEFTAAAQRFAFVEVDGAKHAALCAKYRVTVYPTLVLAAPDGTPLDRIVGLTEADALVAKMNAALTTFVALRPETPGAR